MCARFLANIDSFPKPYKIEVGSGGSGREPMAEWIHCDPFIPVEHHIEIECYAWELPFEDDSIGAIYGRGMWEHMNYRQCEQAFTEWFRVLIPSGIVEFNFPPIDYALELYSKGKIDWNFLKHTLWGWQKFDLDTHQSGWTEEMIRIFLDHYNYLVSKTEIFPGYHKTDGTIVPIDSLDSWDPGTHIWVRLKK
jgi:predicted SAM-dependent methyltransferase